MYKTLVCNSISCPTALQSTVSLRLLWNIDEILAFVACSDTLNICLMLVELERICSELYQYWLQREWGCYSIFSSFFFLSFFLFFPPLFLTFNTLKFQSFTMVYFIKTKFLSNGSKHLANCWSLYFQMVGFFLLILVCCSYHLRYVDTEVDAGPQNTHAHVHARTHTHPHREWEKDVKQKSWFCEVSLRILCLRILADHVGLSLSTLMKRHHEWENSSPTDFFQLKLFE